MPKRKRAPKRAPAPRAKRAVVKKQIAKRTANIMKTGQAKTRAQAQKLARQRAKASASTIAKRSAAKKTTAKGSSAKTNKRGFTAKQQRQIKKRYKNITKTGQAKGKAAIKLARKRTRASMRKTAGKKPTGSVAQQIEQQGGLTQQQQQAAKQLGNTMKEAAGLKNLPAPGNAGPGRNITNPRLRFARKPGAKRDII